MLIETTVFEDIKKLIEGIEIKFDYLAKSYETLDTRKIGDRYTSAKLGLDSFQTYFKFSSTVLYAAGITDPDDIAACIKSKYNIPEDKREYVVTLQRQQVLDDYIEYNNYYRMLWGIPDVQDTDFIYVSDEIFNEYGISNTIPLHQLSNTDIYKLELLGEIDRLKNLYPTKEYLKRLGNKKIDPSISRPASNFTIIRYVNDSTITISESFMEIYSQCREYFLNVIYVPEFSLRYEYYDNFIGAMIMVMTIQRFLSLTFKRGIIREFFDIKYIQYLFESYNVPFIENLPYEQQVAIMRKLNVLLQRKSTDRVLFDLCEILDFGDMDIYKYYLVKQHKLDVDEKPIFVYKVIQDEHGENLLVYDAEAMFDIYFQRINLTDSNLTASVKNLSNKVSYEEVTIDDPYWIEDADLLDKLYNEEYNVIESKYFGLTAVYKMTKMLFEVIYFFRMMLDKKDQLNDIPVYLYRITGDKPIKIFDAIVLVCALFSKKNSMEGNVLYSPTKLMSIYGFNFEKDLQEIKDFVIANPKLVNQSILDYFTDLNIYSADDINKVYGIIRDFNDFIVEQMSTTQNLESYHAYQTIFKSLMVSEESSELFRKSDGVIATTFLEYLEDANIDLYNFVLTTPKDKMSIYLDHVLRRLNKTVTDLKYFYIVNDNNILLDALVKLILFFKSYTVDLTGVNIVYLFDSRYYNKIKLLKKIHLLKTLEIGDVTNFMYKDVFSYLKELDTREYLYKLEKQFYELTYEIKDFSPSLIYDKMTYNKEYLKVDLLNLSYNDFIVAINKIIGTLKDKNLLLNEYYIMNKLLNHIENIIPTEKDTMTKTNTFNISTLLYDIFTSDKSSLYKDNSLVMRDSIRLIWEV